MRGTILEIRAEDPRQAVDRAQGRVVGGVGGIVRRSRARGERGAGTDQRRGASGAGRGRPGGDRHPADRALAGRRVHFGAGGEGEDECASEPRGSACAMEQHRCTRHQRRRRGRQAGEAIRRLRGRQSRQLSGPQGRGVRLPGAQRGGQVDHHPHALRHPQPQRRPGHGGRLRRPHPARTDQGPHRLHEPAVLALPGLDGRGEHRFLQRRVPHPARKEAAAEAVGDRDVGAGPASPPAGGDSFRRLAAAAGPGLRHPPRAAHRVPGRAHLGRRSHQPPAVLGPDLRAFRPGGDDLRHHALHGRSGVLRPAGADLPRAN